MTDITLPRSVVEQALDALKIGHESARDCAETFHIEMSGYKQQRHEALDAEVKQISDAIDALRAALEQPQVEAATGKDYLQVPAGFVLLQTENGKPVYSACLDGGRFHGWLMWKHPDGQWVSKRKLEAWEIMQAEDQRDYGIVQGD